MINLEKYIDRAAALNRMNEMSAMVTNALAQTKLNELLHKEEPKPKKTNPWLIALAVCGGVAVIAGIAYIVYRLACPDYLEDFEDDETVEEPLEAAKEPEEANK